MKPIFTHDCGKCRFVGHFFGHDTYLCGSGKWGSLVARYGSEGSEYATADRVALGRWLRGTHDVVLASHGADPMPFNDLIASGSCPTYLLAIIAGLAVTQLEALA